MKPKLIIYGAGDNGGRFACEYRDIGKYSAFDLVGFIDDFKNGSVAGFPILGSKERLPQLKEEGIDNIVVSLVTDPIKRLETCLELEEMGFKFPSFYPYLPKEMVIGKGVFMYDNVTLLGIHQEIGDFSIIGPYVTLEGETKIGKGVILSPYTFIGHGSEIGDATVFYPKSSCLLHIKVGKNCVIFPNKIVHKNLEDNKKKDKA